MWPGVGGINRSPQAARLLWSAESALLKGLVVAMLEEAQDKHLIDCIAETDLNQDHHIEITLTVGEIRKAAEALGITSF